MRELLGRVRAAWAVLLGRSVAYRVGVKGELRVNTRGSVIRNNTITTTTIGDNAIRTYPPLNS
jgi:hypothetical protein